MYRSILRAVPLLVALGVPVAQGEIYRWVDGAGRQHFTQDLSQVPPQYRKAAEAAARREPPAGKVSRYSTEAAAAPPGAPAPRAAGGGEGGGETTRVMVQRAGTSLMVNVRLNHSVTAPFLIDTGASDVLVPQGVADRLGLEMGPEARTKRYSTANGVVEHPVVMLRSVSLGGATVENVPASVSPHMEVGLLGLSFFNHFTYNIDAAQGVVTLTRNTLASSGHIRGGRSEAQWRAEYANLRGRLTRVEWEYERKSTSKRRERRRLEEVREELLRQLSALETEADRARVPMSWRD